MAFENVKDAKIKTLAETLRNNGLAVSDTEAIRMAEEISGTADKVQQSYENQGSEPDSGTTETEKVVSVEAEKEEEKPEELVAEEAQSNDVYKAKKETMQSSHGGDFDSKKTVQELMDEDAKSVYENEETGEESSPEVQLETEQPEDDITITESEEEAVEEELSQPISEPEHTKEKSSEVQQEAPSPEPETVPEQSSDDDFETETTKKIESEEKSEEERKKVRDAMPESQIDLSDTFNVNK